MIQLISMNEPGLVTRSYHRYIRFNENFSEYKEKIISDDKDYSDAKIALSIAIKEIINNGLNILGINCPEAM